MLPSAALLLLALHAADKDALATVERAIKAHGGATALEKATRCTRTDTGTIHVAGKDMPFTRRVTRDLPGRVRLEMEVGKRVRTRLVLDGDKAYQTEGGPAIALLPQRVTELREDAHAAWLSTLVPLTKPGFTLKALPESKGNVGVLAAFTGRPDARLWFSKETGLLVGMEMRGTDAGVAVDKTYTFAGHKDFGGVKLPTKEAVRRGGQPWTNCTVSDYTFPMKMEASVFSKP